MGGKNEGGSEVDFIAILRDAGRARKATESNHETPLTQPTQ
jgi:hypothetical protein